MGVIIMSRQNSNPIQALSNEMDAMSLTKQAPKFLIIAVSLAAKSGTLPQPSQYHATPPASTSSPNPSRCSF